MGEYWPEEIMSLRKFLCLGRVLLEEKADYLPRPRVLFDRLTASSNGPKYRIFFPCNRIIILPIKR